MSVSADRPCSGLTQHGVQRSSCLESDPVIDPHLGFHGFQRLDDIFQSRSDEAQFQGVASVIRNILHFGPLIIMGQNQRVPFLFQVRGALAGGFHFTTVVSASRFGCHAGPFHRHGSTVLFGIVSA
jgi:hypothetical protein